MKAKNVFGIILNILIVIVIIFVLIIVIGIVQTRILKNEYSSYFGYSFFQVATGSMSPTMEEKDIIIMNILNDEEKEELQIDDIVVFMQGRSFITHRITEISENKITTKGDANNAKDKPVQRKDIIGKVVTIIPKIGVWEKVLTSPEVYISIFVTMILWGVTLSYSTRE